MHFQKGAFSSPQRWLSLGLRFNANGIKLVAEHCPLPIAHCPLSSRRGLSPILLPTSQCALCDAQWSMKSRPKGLTQCHCPINPADDVNADWNSRKQNTKKFAHCGIAIWLDRPAGACLGVGGKHQSQSLWKTAHGTILFNSVASGIYDWSDYDRKKQSRSAHIIS